MQSITLQLINPLGLHARAASKLVGLTKGYGCDVKVAFNDQNVDAKSIMSVMLLAAPVGSELEFTVDGDDEDDALNAIAALVRDGFGELTQQEDDA